MNMLKYISLWAIAGMLLIACDEGIDPISKVDPGPDEQAPVVNITYPGEGALIRVREDVAPIDISYEVTDDIEIQTISLSLDGNKIGEVSDFKDYRRALQTFRYDQLTNGTHTLAVTATDMAGKSTTESVTFEKVEPYQPQYAGEIFYMPFDGDYLELVSITNATKVGSPTFSDEAKDGRSYQGATDAYLTFPSDALENDEFSATFWYNLDATPDRSGILTVGPPDPNNTAFQNNRKSGFRLFRENAGGKQRIKLNVGNGTADNWFDGGAAADITPGSGWVHIAISIGQDKATVFLNGQIVSTNTFPGIDWTETDILTIGSGAPRFTEWGHLSDKSLYDELRIFDKALTQAEVQEIMAGG